MKETSHLIDKIGGLLFILGFVPECLVNNWTQWQIFSFRSNDKKKKSPSNQSENLRPNDLYLEEDATISQWRRREKTKQTFIDLFWIKDNKRREKITTIYFWLLFICSNQYKNPYLPIYSLISLAEVFPYVEKKKMAIELFFTIDINQNRKVKLSSNKSPSYLH